MNRRRSTPLTITIPHENPNAANTSFIPDWAANMNPSWIARHDVYANDPVYYRRDQERNFSPIGLGGDYIDILRDIPLAESAVYIPNRNILNVSQPSAMSIEESKENILSSNYSSIQIPSSVSSIKLFNSSIKMDNPENEGAAGILDPNAGAGMDIVNGPRGGKFKSPFSAQNYNALTGIDLRDSFAGIDKVAGYRSKGRVLTDEQKKDMTFERAKKLRERFSLTDWSKPNMDQLAEDVHDAMAELAKALADYRITVMFDDKGYFAYKVSYNYDFEAYSTNLTRLRRMFKLGVDRMGPGPGIIATIPRIPTNAELSIGNNYVWGVLISWHKLLNSFERYDEKYANRGFAENYKRFQRKKQKNLARKAYTLALGDNFTKYGLKLKEGVQKYAARADRKLQAWKPLVDAARTNVNANPQQVTKLKKRYCDDYFVPY